MSLVKAISRTGEAKEALGGPLIYVVVLFLCTSLFWRNSLLAPIAVCEMAAGDGLADIVGRRFGTTKWSFSPQKSVAGTLAFVLGGFIVTELVLLWFRATGCVEFDPIASTWRVMAISVACAFIELVCDERVHALAVC
jgi:phytol kinase